MRFPFFCEEFIRNGFGVTDAVDNYGVLLDVEDRLVNEVYKYLIFRRLYSQWLISLPYPSISFQSLCIPLPFPYRSPREPRGMGGSRMAGCISVVKWWGAVPGRLWLCLLLPVRETKKAGRAGEV